jgi:fructose-1,6-bisphosphatase/inositol monophosphatase family enzyme
VRQRFGYGSELSKEGQLGANRHAIYHSIELLNDMRCDRIVKWRYGGDCYAYCMLAAGLIDLVIETEIKPHDIVPLIPIIAGGIVTTWENGPAQNRGRIVAASDRRVHQVALEMLKG